MKPVTTIQEYLDNLLRVSPRKDEIAVFRGHSDRSYKLIPHVFRENSFRANEHILLSELIAAQPAEFCDDVSTLERLVRMQHYDLPTRLLDISHNPLVALYFATASKKTTRKNPAGSRYKTTQVEKDGQVVCLHVGSDLIKYFDSDTVACLANIALLKPEHKKELVSKSDYIELNACEAAKRLVHFINAEKPGFLNEIKPEHLRNVYLVKPKQNNRRIVAQSGGFFSFGLNEKIAEGGIDGISVDRITIEGEQKAAIRRELDKLGINEKSMFPELDRVARYLKNSLKVNPKLL